jgi:hypothetical protein
MIEMDPLSQTYCISDISHIMDNVQYYTHINQPLSRTFKETSEMLLKQAEKLCNGGTMPSMGMMIIL